MNEKAWKIIDGICNSIGVAFFLCFFFGNLEPKAFLIFSVIAILGVLLALVIGKLLFGE